MKKCKTQSQPSSRNRTAPRKVTIGDQSTFRERNQNTRKVKPKPSQGRPTAPWRCKDTTAGTRQWRARRDAWRAQSTSISPGPSALSASAFLSASASFLSSLAGVGAWVVSTRGLILLMLFGYPTRGGESDDASLLRARLEPDDGVSERGRTRALPLVTPQPESGPSGPTSKSDSSDGSRNPAEAESAELTQLSSPSLGSSAPGSTDRAGRSVPMPLVPLLLLARLVLVVMSVDLAALLDAALETGRDRELYTYIGSVLVAVGVHGGGVGSDGHLLLLLDLLDGVGRLKVEHAVQIEARLDLDDRVVALGVGGDALDGELADPGVDALGDLVRGGVVRLEVKVLLAVEGEDLGGGDGVVGLEDDQLGVLVGHVGGLVPGDLDRVRGGVVDAELAHLEDGREDGAGERAAAGHSLVLVRGERERLAEEGRDALLERRHARRAADHLNRVDLVLGEAGLGEGGLEGHVDALEEGRDELLKLLALELGAGVDVLHEVLDVQRGEGVGGEHLLEALAAGGETEGGLGAGEDVNLVLALELLGKVLEEGTVEIATAEVAVGGGAEDGELALAERDHGDLVGGVTDVAEDDVARVVRLGEVGLGDAVAEGGGGGVVEEAEGVEAGDLGGVEVGASLSVGEPERGGEDDVAYASAAELLGGGVAELDEVHGEELGGGEGLFLTCEANLDADLALCVDELCVDEVLLDLLDLGVLEGATYETLERADGVLEVGALRRQRDVKSSAAGQKAGMDDDARDEMMIPIEVG
ncbi:hypothetical protein L1887_52632 [Cichorium endivia]|nr:hypothetical protein L1887_52632 [Cichorium endivia]